ncbi:MAG: TOMM precursor leader peptide-binding protein [Candidatus Dormibacteraeota bacterium]|nr:TOMM precursor leader peptide-binding protein [Candidatus Dormibacteraeota bacterium]
MLEPDGVYLLSERGHHLLRGELYCRLAPLLDGSRSLDEVVDTLAAEATPAEIYYVVAGLEERGYVVEAEAGRLGRAAFWQGQGLEAGDAERRLGAARITVAGYGGIAVEPLSAALAELEIGVGADGELAVVVSDDYLQEGLAEFNSESLAAGRPWLLLKPVGLQVWIGPLFRPGSTGCWECLAQRLRGNRQVETYLQQQQRRAAPFPVSRVVIGGAAEAALRLAAIQIAIVLGGAAGGLGEGEMVTLEVDSLETKQHRLVRRPQCPCCGDPGRWSRAAEPIRLRSQKKRFTADGGHRVVSPEQTLARYGHHVSPITGAVSNLEPVPPDDDAVLRVWVASLDPWGNRRVLDLVPRGLQVGAAWGKGLTDAEARVSALGEALEGWSGAFSGDEPRTVASYRRLGDSAIHPNACMLFSPAQYQTRAAWNACHSRPYSIPDPSDEDAEFEWTRAWSLTRRSFRHVPTGFCFHGYPVQAGADYHRCDANGHAAGNTLEEAIVHGLLELVERDGLTLWWYNRIQRPEVDLDSFDDVRVSAIRSSYEYLRRDLWVLDLTSDLEIPTFAAVSRRGGEPRNWGLGFGAHLDPRTALLRALAELNQFDSLLAAVSRSGREWSSWAGNGRDRAHARPWWEQEDPAEYPHFLPDPTQARTTSSTYARSCSADLRDDLLLLQEVVEGRGLELLVVDQTRPDIELPVVQVIVPGLRHFRPPRLAPGRLYDVPVELGWLSERLAEDQLNPVPLVL